MKRGIIFFFCFCRYWSWPPTTSAPPEHRPLVPVRPGPAAARCSTAFSPSLPPPENGASSAAIIAPHAGFAVFGPLRRPRLPPPVAGAGHPPRHPAGRVAPLGVLRRLRGRLRRLRHAARPGRRSTRRSAARWPGKSFSRATATPCATSTPWRTSCPSCSRPWAAAATRSSPSFSAAWTKRTSPPWPPPSPPMSTSTPWWWPAAT